MQTSSDKKIENQRKFKVGIVGASETEFESISRIFAITRFRKRFYVAQAVPLNAFKRQLDVDFILMCSNNPNIIAAWNNSNFALSYGRRPNIFLARSPELKLGRYQLNSPVNPSRFIKLLDHYTISVLNFLPEFEIGSDDHFIADSTLSGLKILKNNLRENKNKNREPEKNVLVVDDSLAVRRQMQIEFELRRDNLDLANNAEEALQAISQKKYDLIFLDIVMPGMDGYTVCKKIKKSELNGNTPVVLLTSRSSSFDKIKGALAGCDSYLIKPINHNEFEAVYDKYTFTRFPKGEANAS